MRHDRIYCAQCQPVVFVIGKFWHILIRVIFTNTQKMSSNTVIRIGLKVLPEACSCSLPPYRQGCSKRTGNAERLRKNQSKGLYYTAPAFFECIEGCFICLEHIFPLKEVQHTVVRHLDTSQASATQYKPQLLPIHTSTHQQQTQPSCPAVCKYLETASHMQGKGACKVTHCSQHTPDQSQATLHDPLAANPTSN